ncbi:hypothetical protein nbrc107696_10500 [Gordonia spumicola]|uniref:Uncharacterized protein n=1 Tax=Gordonia spumicola TaxID=589161 RepID=A0A7I9V5X2_9ACTN|nr:hypothetical protein nbrc107696_10500 [Gordonia spumicola]
MVSQRGDDLTKRDCHRADTDGTHDSEYEYPAADRQRQPESARTGRPLRFHLPDLAVQFASG